MNVSIRWQERRNWSDSALIRITCVFLCGSVSESTKKGTADKLGIISSNTNISVMQIVTAQKIPFLSITG
jgi:hypothetical protein